MPSSMLASCWMVIIFCTLYHSNRSPECEFWREQLRPQPRQPLPGCGQCVPWIACDPQTMRCKSVMGSPVVNRRPVRSFLQFIPSDTNPAPADFDISSQHNFTLQFNGSSVGSASQLCTIFTMCWYHDLSMTLSPKLELRRSRFEMPLRETLRLRPTGYGFLRYLSFQ